MSYREPDPIFENVLRAHGVKCEEFEKKSGPRDPAKINLIIADIRAARRRAGFHVVDAS